MKKKEIPTVESIYKSGKEKRLIKKEQNSLFTVDEICSIFISRQFVIKQNDLSLRSKW